MNELYKRIESIAASRGLSVWALCQKADVAPQRLHALKQNPDARMSAQNLKKISEALGVSMERLLYGENGSGRIVYVNLDRKMPEMKSVFAKFTERELIYWIAEMTAELQRRKVAEQG